MQNKRRTKPPVYTPVLLFIFVCSFVLTAQAVEMSDKLAQSQGEKSKGKFIDDWDEVKQEYKSDDAQKEQDSVVTTTSKVLEKNEAKLNEELERFQDPNLINPTDYYKYKKQSMAEDFEQGEKARLQREKEQKEQKEKEQSEQSTASSTDNDQSNGEQQPPETTAQIPKSAVDDADSSSDPNKKIFHSVAQEQEEDNKKDEASVFDYMSIIKQDASKLQNKIDEEQQQASNGTSEATKGSQSTVKSLDKPMIDETQKELESFAKKKVDQKQEVDTSSKIEIPINIEIKTRSEEKPAAVKNAESKKEEKQEDKSQDKVKLAAEKQASEKSEKIENKHEEKKKEEKQKLTQNKKESSDGEDMVSAAKNSILQEKEKIVKEQQEKQEQEKKREQEAKKSIEEEARKIKEEEERKKREEDAIQKKKQEEEKAKEEKHQMTIKESKDKLDKLEKKIETENPKGWEFAIAKEKKSKEIADAKLNNVVKWISTPTLKPQQNQTVSQQITIHDIVKEKMMMDDNKDEKFLKDEHLKKIQSKTIKASKKKSLDPMLSQDGLESVEAQNMTTPQHSNKTTQQAEHEKTQEPVKKKDQQQLPQQVQAKPTNKSEEKKVEVKPDKKEEPKKLETKKQEPVKQEQIKQEPKKQETTQSPQTKPQVQSQVKTEKKMETEKASLTKDEKKKETEAIKVEVKKTSQKSEHKNDVARKEEIKPAQDVKKPEQKYEFKPVIQHKKIETKKTEPQKETKSNSSVAQAPVKENKPSIYISQEAKKQVKREEHESQKEIKKETPQPKKESKFIESGGKNVATKAQQKTTIHQTPNSEVKLEKKNEKFAKEQLNKKPVEQPRPVTQNKVIKVNATQHEQNNEKKKTIDDKKPEAKQIENTTAQAQLKVEKPKEQAKKPQVSKMHYRSAPIIESKISPSVKTTNSDIEVKNEKVNKIERKVDVQPIKQNKTDQSHEKFLNTPPQNPKVSVQPVQSLVQPDQVTESRELQAKKPSAAIKTNVEQGSSVGRAVNALRQQVNDRVESTIISTTKIADSISPKKKQDNANNDKNGVVHHDEVSKGSPIRRLLTNCMRFAAFIFG